MTVTSEVELFQGYSHLWQPDPSIRPCACGEPIVCVPDDIPLGVMAHNLTTAHQRWRQRGGMEATIDGPVEG